MSKNSNFTGECLWLEFLQLRWMKWGLSIACRLVFSWAQNGITMSHCPPQSATQIHHSQQWHCACNNTASWIPQGMFLVVQHLPTNRHSITHHYHQMWQQHPAAQECLAPCGPQSAGPTEFHTMGGTQTSHIQPRHNANDFHIIRQLKNLQRPYVHMGQQSAGGCGVVVQTAPLRIFLTGYTDMCPIGTPVWVYAVIFSNCCSTFTHEHPQTGFSCTGFT